MPIEFRKRRRQRSLRLHLVVVALAEPRSPRSAQAFGQGRLRGCWQQRRLQVAVELVLTGQRALVEAAIAAGVDDLHRQELGAAEELDLGAVLVRRGAAFDAVLGDFLAIEEEAEAIIAAE